MNPKMKFLLEKARGAQAARQSYESFAAKLLTPGAVVEVSRGPTTYRATVAERGEGSTACVFGGRVWVVSDAGRGYWIGLSRVVDFH